MWFPAVDDEAAKHVADGQQADDEAVVAKVEDVVRMVTKAVQRVVREAGPAPNNGTDNKQAHPAGSKILQAIAQKANATLAPVVDKIADAVVKGNATKLYVILFSCFLSSPSLVILSIEFCCFPCLITDSCGAKVHDFIF